MADGASMRSNSSDAVSKLGGICGVLTGLLFIATFAVGYNLPDSPSRADSTLAGFDSLRASFLAADVFLGLVVVFAIPFYTALRSSFNGKDDLLIGTATLFSIIGFVVTATVVIGESITLDTLSGPYAAGGASRNAAVVVAQAVIGFGAVAIFGLLVLFAGVAVYGFVAIKGRRFPRWLGFAGILAALLSLGTPVPVIGTFLFVVAFVLLLLWIFATSAYLWRPTTGKTMR